jgi:hypothetical protein
MFGIHFARSSGFRAVNGDFRIPVLFQHSGAGVGFEPHLQWRRPLQFLLLFLSILAAIERNFFLEVCNIRFICLREYSLSGRTGEMKGTFYGKPGTFIQHVSFCLLSVGVGKNVSRQAGD